MLAVDPAGEQFILHALAEGGLMSAAPAPPDHDRPFSSLRSQLSLHERAALDGLELVAPDPPRGDDLNGPGGRVCHAMRRFSSNSVTVLTMEYGIADLHRHPERVAERRRREPCLASRTVPEPSMSGDGSGRR